MAVFWALTTGWRLRADLKVAEEKDVKKKIAVLAFAPVMLYGCATQVENRVPVVDSGTRLSTGAPVAAVQQPSAPVVATRTQNEVVQVMTPPEAGLPAIDTGSITVDPQAARLETGSVSTPVVATSAPAIASQSSAAQVEAPVLALLSTAQQQRGTGDLNGAASSLERAQRIAPREPQVLYRLAEIRLMQGDAAQAEQLAQRGLSYSAGKPALQAGLWDLIAEARDKQGNASGAAEARQKARAFM